MALLGKKLYMKNSAGTTQTANIYGTTGEVGTNYMRATVDGTNGYIPLLSTSDVRATSGRVTKSGTTYAIGSIPIPAYTKWGKASGSGNFTVPAGVYKLRVTCVGGGAGGVIVGNGIATSGTSTISETGGAGGTTTFGSVTAKGGTASTIKKVSTCTYYDSEYNTCTSASTSTTITLGAGYAKAVSIAGNTDTVAGTPVPILDYNGNTLYEQHGKGGNVNAFGKESATVGNKYAYSAVVGASGYRTVQTISVTPGQTIAWSVGAGGSGVYNYYGTRKVVSAWTTIQNGGVGPGVAGAIVVEYGKGIE